MAKKVARRQTTGRADRAASGRRLLPPDGGVAIRMYRQGLGDCFLLAFAGADPNDPAYVLIDCGVHAAQTGGRAVLRQVVDNVIEATDGRLDVLAVTHEHTDHLSGFVQAADAFLNRKLRPERLWLAWTEDESDPAAKRLRRGRVAAKRAVEAALKRLREKAKTDGARRDLASLALSARLEAAHSFFDTTPDDEDGRRSAGLAERLGLRDPDKVTGNELALALLKSLVNNPTYLRPGRRMPVPGSRARAYVLGPPLDTDLLNRSDPSAGDRHETYLSSAIGLVSFAAAVGADGPADAADAEHRELCFPFDDRFRRDYDWARRQDFFRDRYPLEPDGYAEAWRSIENDWLHAAEELALHLDRHTNNTSLVLAFEIGEPGAGPVLLFVGDAQVGNWLSWKGVPAWRAGRRNVDVADLLRRTAVYKVGHHASHNATLRRDETGVDYGLELMPEGLVALVPVDQAAADKLPGWDMPYGPLYRDALRRKTRGNILRSDDGHDPRLPIPRVRFAGVPGVPGAKWRSGFAKKPDGKPLYYDLTMTTRR